MCAILDANVVHEVFGSSRPEAGVKFFQWLNTGKNQLVTGGRAYDELKGSSDDFRRWAVQARLAGIMREENRFKVSTRTEELEAQGKYKSNDPHVLALAQVSDVRLLYTNDGDLQQDFGNKSLIDNPRGKVYSTRVNNRFTSTHRRLLNSKNICKVAH